ncbi:insulin-like growth factor-binding protein 3 receptor [Tachyglossus aculeatus]|uniref:insulin-like growth factor-binding protein 3 receptor n=1 Tax=Tachyglossus aculeatus TaxID=9261 RepID=UPI0018F392D7|nr:insulin-like growth factor-binding protein 3 receptor [Tachyglossus aculeatus]XP_038619231.1 insulin-like growth factor-binding protein 3 receptor [Tachyglossus aculeatus]XP_038619232.1 insulin-like growth factor-binding protein 3 receptor [Tachyglossus aculeatus]
MGSWQAGKNLRYCLAHRPPLVCAALSLLLLGAAGLGLGTFVHFHGAGLRDPDVPQDWISFLRSLGQLSLCPGNGSAAGRPPLPPGTHSVRLLTRLSLGGGPKGNKTRRLQAAIWGHQLGLTGLSAGEVVLLTAQVPMEGTAGTCLVFTAARSVLPPSQPPQSCREEGDGDAVNVFADENPSPGEECYRVWGRGDVIVTKLLTSEELALCGSRLLYSGCFLLFVCGLLCCCAAVGTHPHWETPLPWNQI